MPSLCQKKRKTFLSLTRDGELGAKKSIQTNLVLLTLIFLATSSPFTAPNPNPCVVWILHKFIVSLSKKYKSFLLLSLRGFILLRKLPCTCKNLTQCVCFSPANMSYHSLILRLSQRPNRLEENFTSLTRQKTDLQKKCIQIYLMLTFLCDIDRGGGKTL